LIEQIPLVWAYNPGWEIQIIIRQTAYLSNIVKQDRKAVKRVTRPVLNFKSFRSAKKRPGRPRTQVHDSQRTFNDGNRCEHVFRRSILRIGRANLVQLERGRTHLLKI
jgi:transposase-like protein